MSHEPRIVITQVKEGRWVFEVIGGNGEVQARSEGYDSKSNAERGLDDLVNSLASIKGLTRHPELPGTG